VTGILYTERLVGSTIYLASSYQGVFVQMKEGHDSSVYFCKAPLSNLEPLAQVVVCKQRTSTYLSGDVEKRVARQ